MRLVVLAFTSDEDAARFLASLGDGLMPSSVVAVSLERRPGAGARSWVGRIVSDQKLRGLIRDARVLGPPVSPLIWFRRLLVVLFPSLGLALDEYYKEHAADHAKRDYHNRRAIHQEGF